MPGRRGAETGRLPTVIWRRGVHLLGTGLWFDAAGGYDLCFLSSACAWRPAKHRKVVCTPAVAALVRARRGRVRALTVPYGHPVQLGRLRLELLPNGHALGSAQLVVEHEGVRILYTGTVATQAAPTAAPLETRPADLVIAHAFCAPPDLPETTPAAAEEQLLAFARESLAAGATPVLLVEALGPAQDVLRVIGDADLPVAAHLTVFRHALDYRECGERFPLIQRFRGAPPAGHVIVWPRRGYATAALARLQNVRIALVGYDTELPPSGPEAAPIERIIPYGNRSTPSALLQWLRALEARRVVFHGPYDRALAARFHAETGVDTAALSQSGQMVLI